MDSNQTIKQDNMLHYPLRGISNDKTVSDEYKDETNRLRELSDKLDAINGYYKLIEEYPNEIAAYINLDAGVGTVFRMAKAMSLRDQDIYWIQHHPHEHMLPPMEPPSTSESTSEAVASCVSTSVSTSEAVASCVSTSVGSGTGESTKKVDDNSLPSKKKKRNRRGKKKKH